MSSPWAAVKRTPVAKACICHQYVPGSNAALCTVVSVVLQSVPLAVAVSTSGVEGPEIVYLSVEFELLNEFPLSFVKAESTQIAESPCRICDGMRETNMNASISVVYVS